MSLGNIALIGFRTTGKTRVGRILARKLARTFVDMDDFLTQSFGTTIDCWVRRHGWKSFREQESELLSRLAEMDGVVVATGGGVVLNRDNREILKRAFQVVWLKASADTIESRMLADPVSVTQRPPLSSLPLREEIETLLRERTPLYAAAARISVDTDLLCEEGVVERILDLVEREQ
ncbi:MAG TPA: shikimate kinase [Syntrophobacteraceae bacterium]|nr:shikimate kinase [Syntrophobacteraceae bacterium]